MLVDWVSLLNKHAQVQAESHIASAMGHWWRQACRLEHGAFDLGKIPTNKAPRAIS